MLKEKRQTMSEENKQAVLTCAYCTIDYKWINHVHTQGFYEHSSNPDCRFYQHRILQRSDRQ